MQSLEGLDHLGAGQGVLVQLDEGLVVTLRSQDRQYQVLEHGAVLPGLATMGQGLEACRLERVGSGEQFVQGGGHLGPGLLEHLRVDPQPVDPVDVHRHSYVMVVVFPDGGELGRQQLVPLVGLGHVVELGEQPQGAPLLDIRALDLRGGGWVAGDGAALEYGHGRGTATAGHGVVLPGEAVLLDLLLEGVHGRGLATGGPPVQDFDGAIVGGGNGQRHE